MKKYSSLEELKKHYPIMIELPLAWGEMDPFHHINNIFYFRYFESARMHYLGLIGALDYLEEHNVGPILASTDCKFISPLKWPDNILVGVRVETEHMGEDRFEMSYVVWSKGQNKLAAMGSSVVVYYDYNETKKALIPNQIRERIVS